MVNPIVSEILNAARRKVELNRRATEIVRRAGPLVRQAMEERVTAREQATNARTAPKPSGDTQAVPATPVLDDLDTAVPEPSRRSAGPVDQQQQLQQQQRIFGGQRGVENALLEGDDEAVDIAESMGIASQRAAAARQLDSGTLERRNQYAEASSSFDERNVFVSPEDQGIRFEIDDGLSRINPRYLQRLSSSAPDQQGFRALPDSKTETATLRLGDIFEHAELARFYPEYKDIKIARVPENSTNQGTFDPRTNTLSLRTFYGDEEQLRTTIIHELQHYVQRQEGFARGGSLNEFVDPKDLDGFPTITARYQALDTKLERLGQMNKNNPANKAIRSVINDTLAEKALVDRIRREAYDKYRRFTGEKEAFDTERRLRMTPFEKVMNQPALADREFMDDAITLGQGETLKGNIVPGMSFENDHIVFHGGPTSAIDKFMLKYIGTGEGAIMRGWGFYFAERPGISVGYKEGRAREKKIKGDREAIFEINPAIWNKDSAPGALKAAEEKISNLILQQAEITDTLNSRLSGKVSTTYKDILSSKSRFLGIHPGTTTNSKHNTVAEWIADAITTFAYNGKVRRVSSIENLAEKIADSIKRHVTDNQEGLMEAKQTLPKFDEYIDNEFEFIRDNIDSGLTDAQFNELLSNGILSDSYSNDSLVKGFFSNNMRAESVFGLLIGDAKEQMMLDSKYGLRFGFAKSHTKEEMLEYVNDYQRALGRASNTIEQMIEEELPILDRLFTPDYEFDFDTVVYNIIDDKDFFRFELAGNPSTKDDAGLFVLDLKANKNKDYLHLDKPMRQQSFKIKKILLDVSVDKTLDGVGEDVVKSLEGFIWDRIRSSGGDISSLKGFTDKGREGIKRAYRTTMDTSNAYNNLRWDNRKFASLVLKEWGIPGSAHWDTFSRDPGMPETKRTNNFVIWDEDIIEQLAVQPHSWAGRGKLEVDPADHPLTDEYKPQ